MSISRMIVMVSILGILAGGAWAEGGQVRARLGDVNHDGSCNVLDVQACVAQALQTQERTWEADIDENGQVNIFDVQHGINSALGTGGLMQQVCGQLQCDDPQMLQDRIRVRAVSEDGEMVEGDVDPETGEFCLSLRAKQAWSVAFFGNANEQGQRQVGVMQFRIAGETTPLMPIPELSQGDKLDLGQVQFAAQIQCQNDVLAMLGHINQYGRGQDSNGDGLPDFVEPLVNRAQNGPGVPQGMDAGGLRARVGSCVAEWLDAINAPNLVDENGDGVPDFIEPLMACIQSNIEGWYQENGHQGNNKDDDGNGVPDFIDNIVDYIVAGVPEWVEGLNYPETIDSDGDGVPDYIQNKFGEPQGSHYVDADEDGKPDFAQDGNGDGIPNCDDPEYRNASDCDGDGIVNPVDTDDDNDGVPDYADAEPCNPEVS